MKILDLGSGDGSYIASLLNASVVPPEQVWIADPLPWDVEAGRRRYGFNAVVIPEAGPLPFDDHEFDLVFCNSVIEHVTLSTKAECWRAFGSRFHREAWRRQQAFAREIARVGQGYFVQTPNRWFPIESHTLLPLAGYLPRPAMPPLAWILDKTADHLPLQRSIPDFNLLTGRQMAALFPEAAVVPERVYGMTKSWIAVKRPDLGPRAQRQEAETPTAEPHAPP